jgi:hypothetical protein
MLNPEIARRVDRLLAAYAKGVFTEDELAENLGLLVTADNLSALADRLSPELLVALKRGIDHDNRRVADNECLHPPASPFDWVTVSGEYYRNIAAALLEPDAPKRRGLLSVVCLPSFEAEWALRLLGADNKGYALALSVAEKQIWSSRTTAPVAVKQMEVPLTAELGALLCEVWRKMLLRVRHSQSVGIGLDGVTYHFACHGPGVGLMAGETWSPDSQTAPGKLVALSHLLYRYVEETDAGRSGLIGEIQQAVDWFRVLA